MMCCVQDLLHFDSGGRITNIQDYEAYVLMAGMFIGRALVTTVSTLLSLTPHKYSIITHHKCVPTHIYQRE